MRWGFDIASTPPLGGRRRADIVFTRRRIVVFIDGCFWHRWLLLAWMPPARDTPKSNASYWVPKLRRNIEQDHEIDAQLRAASWTVMRFWEHEDAQVVA